MQAEEAIEVDRRIRRAALRLGNGDARTHRIVIAFAKRHHHVEPIHRAPLKEHHHFLAARSCRRGRGHRALQE